MMLVPRLAAVVPGTHARPAARAGVLPPQEPPTAPPQGAPFVFWRLPSGGYEVSVKAGPVFAHVRRRCGRWVAFPCRSKLPILTDRVAYGLTRLEASERALELVLVHYRLEPSC